MDEEEKQEAELDYLMKGYNPAGADKKDIPEVLEEMKRTKRNNKLRRLYRDKAMIKMAEKMDSGRLFGSGINIRIDISK